MMYDLVHGLAVIKDTDHFYLREHRIVIRDTDVLSLICKENSPGRVVKHFFSPEAWRMEERSVEIFNISRKGLCADFCVFTRKFIQGGCVHRVHESA